MPHSSQQKIFVTVGTDLPFDRLIGAIDAWAANNPNYSILAQIGNSDTIPEHMKYQRFVEPNEYKSIFSDSDLIISHAGMGTILTSLRYQKPLIVIPRKASLNEHRNEHQLATAKYLQSLNKVEVAKDEVELIRKLGDFQSLRSKEPIGPYASKRLTDAIKYIIHQ